MNIGYKIKELRINNGLTQEKLAELLGVSFQAVSKWENDISLPDILLLPKIASVFNISIDELFDFETEEKKEEIKRIKEEFNTLKSDNFVKAKDYIFEKLKVYPDDETLLSLSLYVLSVNTEADKMIEIAKKLIARTRSDEIKYEALRFLAYAYKEKGDYEAAKGAAEKIPEMCFTKFTELAYLCEGEEKFLASSKQIRISANHLLEMMWKTAEYYTDTGEISKAIDSTEDALKIIEILNDSYFDGFEDFFKNQLRLLSVIF